MGLLDDAIREHLDLKRRRGADPAEVERAEREALGPVRRNRDPGEEADAEPAPMGARAYDHADEKSWTGEPSAENWSQEIGTDAWSDALGSGEWSRDAAEDEPDFSSRPEPPRVELSAERLPDRGEPADPQPGRRPNADTGETVEYDVEQALGEGPSDEDMLEETPEFLQDTPDHDRLWFEQRPPRDFDFDG
ncbi:MAG: hypothetical protein ACLP50_30955 [Solirubrobacteraceae bacterium]